MNNVKERLIKGFKNNFKKDPQFFFDCGGRIEIIGNHTDHNHGLCMAATCSLVISAAVSKRDDNIIEMISEGFKPCTVDLSNLKSVPTEKGTSNGLMRGVAEYLVNKGYKVGGLTFYSVSTVFPGAGVSSSAAFELLIAELFNALYNEGKIDSMTMCKAGQYGENEHFGKKSGLLDQIGVGYGNMSFINFNDIEHPIVKQVKFPFDDLHFVIVNTGGSHAELSDLYSAIPMDMKNAARKCGHEFLAEGTMEEIEKNKDKLSDIEYSRAKHFYSENERVLKAVEALENKDEKSFLAVINGSRESSTKDLKNMMVGNQYEGSPLEACDLAVKAMNNEGAVRINGGGFAGSIICIVPTKRLDSFTKTLGDKYGSNNVQEVSVRPYGPKEF